MSTEYLRERSFNQRPYHALRTARYYDTGEIYSSTVTDGVAEDTQATMGRETMFRRIQWLKARGLIRDTYLDVGSAFTTVTKSYDDNNIVSSIGDRRWISSVYSYTGPIWVVQPSASRWPEHSDTAMHQEMLQLGATAISRTIPTNPVVGAGVAIGESMERLPAAPGRALLGRPGNISKKFADEYLNLEFGLKPLVSDIRATARAARESAKIRAQLKRDSGRLIRRRYEFPVVESVSLRSGTGFYSWPAMDTQMYKNSGTWTSERKIRTRTWFSGAYTYYYDEGSDLSSRMARTEQELNRLYGLRLTPSLAWELSPWSWLADWKTNAGDVISNISALSRDGLVLRWGYVMQEKIITDTYRAKVYPHSGGIIEPEQIFKTHVKKRIRATPYGFGLDPDWKDFSSRQLAILGALGISRGR